MMSHVFRISHEFSINEIPCEVYKGNLNAKNQVWGWHDLNEFLGFSWLQYNACFLQHAKVNSFLSEQAQRVCRVLTWWEMQETRGRSTPALPLTTGEHRVFGGIFWRLLVKPVWVTAHNDEPLVLPLLSLQQRRHTELVCWNKTGISGSSLIISSASHCTLNR